MAFGNREGLKIPAIYGVKPLSSDHKSGGAILMEDLSEKAVVQDFEKPFSEKQV